MTGPVSFVPLEKERFKEGVYQSLIEEKCLQLGRIYRRRLELEQTPYYSNYISPSK